jgi:hypothetical protein
MNATAIGLDLAKNLFQVHGVDCMGKPLLRKQLKRKEVLAFFANLPRALIGIEACAGAHYWARELIKLGHDVRLISPQFVKPYVKGNNNDANDAEAICEAVGRPNMRFVPLKSPQQQDLQMLHRVCRSLVKERTGVANQTRGVFGLLRLAGGLGSADQGLRGQDPGGLSQQPGVPETGDDPRCGTDHRDGNGRGLGRGQEFRERPAGGGLAGHRASAPIQWRQAEAAGTQQARRYLPAHLADPWRSLGRQDGGGQG